ncbi:MAG: hypothetical protein IJ381_00145 [Clostridia bacterium]|nr:hypothetical protein [Clostridia bacterium]
MMRKSSADMQDVFCWQWEAKCVPAKANRAKEKKSRKPAVDASLLRAERF